MLKFVPYKSSPQHPRRSFQRACEKCRKRKKRCFHDIYSDSRGTETSQSLTDESPAIKRTRHDGGRRPEQKSGGDDVRNSTADIPLEDGRAPSNEDDGPASISEDDEPRFVGVLNPEATFLAARSPTNSMVLSDTNILGVWISQQSTGRSSRRHGTSWTHRGSEVTSSPHTRCHMPSPWEGMQLLEIPEGSDFRVLYKIYLEDIHPIFPVLDCHVFEALSPSSPERSLLRQALCIAASTSPMAKDYLKTPSRSAGYTSRDKFIKDMVFSIRYLLSIGLVRDKMILVQVLSLVALFTQFARDRDLSAELSASAVGYCHTSGLHLQGQITQGNDRLGSVHIRLFCCVWALDKLNAAFHGRPVMMHERDIGRDLETCFAQQEPCFQLFLRTVSLLDNIIGLYRPRKDTSVIPEHDFPLFEDVVEKSSALCINSQYLGTIEMLYHSVAMLSCRTTTLQEPPTSSASFLRQSLSALKATAIISGDIPNQLSNLPIVPYAISLSLRVAYRELRLSRSPMMRNRARKQLLTNAALLRELGSVYGSAAVLATMVDSTLLEMDKLIQSTQQQQQQQQTGDPNTSSALDSSSPADQSPSSRRPSTSSLSPPGSQRDDNLTSAGAPDPDSSEIDFANIDLPLFDNMFDLDIFSHLELDWSQT